MKYLPAELYRQIEQSIPISCVDFVTVRSSSAGREFGLIKRRSPFGEVWCHLGGRIGRGESIREALLRHADETLGVSLVLDDDPQPAYVYQWFPPTDRPAAVGTVGVGDDPRKHAIGLTFALEVRGDPTARNEAIDFSWYTVGERPAPLWPGCAPLLARLRV